MKAKAGDILTFRGCAWDDGWEFDAPLVIYEPIQRYFNSGSVSPAAIADKVEDICIDLCTDGGVRAEWHPSDLKEFKWRGWSPTGFTRRRNAIHAKVTVKFRNGADRLEFDVIAAAQVSRSGKLTPIFEGTPPTVRKR